MNESFETFKLCSGSAARATTVVVALVKNQAQDTRCKNMGSVAFWDVLSGIWGSLGFCNSAYLAWCLLLAWGLTRLFAWTWTGLGNQFTNLYSPLPRFSSSEGRLQVCAHGYTR
ncbi:hypothetical protein B0H14DRAFT_3875539 [Mycena olivaceomarginata]|nr:hypothetical protein B0H14DRAFT_3875539 [Mycena olivaceomarginata]